MKWRYEQAKENLRLEFAMSRHRISEAPSSPSPVVWESYHKSILVHRALRKTVINYISEGQLHTPKNKTDRKTKKQKVKHVIQEREPHVRECAMNLWSLLWFQADSISAWMVEPLSC